MARVKIDLEYIFRASPAIIYTFVTSSECLIRWYCDEVDIVSDVYYFGWEGSSEVATMVDDIEEERVRFIKDDAPSTDEYLEFRMYRSAVTNETILEVTEFCDDDEVEEIKDLWNSLMVELKKECGG